MIYSSLFLPSYQLLTDKWFLGPPPYLAVHCCFAYFLTVITEISIENATAAPAKNFKDSSAKPLRRLREFQACNNGFRRILYHP